MSGVNKVILVGRLGQDPESKQVNNNTVCRFSVATSEQWNDKQGQKQERTEWHRVNVWGKIAENCVKYLSKGKQVYIEGKLQTRSWEKDGQKHYATEITANTVQFLSPAGASTQSGGGQAGSNDFGPEPCFDASEEIPF